MAELEKFLRSPEEQSPDFQERQEALVSLLLRFPFRLYSTAQMAIFGAEAEVVAAVQQALRKAVEVEEESLEGAEAMEAMMERLLQQGFLPSPVLEGLQAQLVQGAMEDLGDSLDNQEVMEEETAEGPYSSMDILLRTSERI